MKLKAVALALFFALIANSAAEASRPAGGGVGGDIIVFDIVDA